MHIIKNKNVIITTALILMFVMTSIPALPTADAQYKRDSYAIIGLKPDHVSVNQEVLITLGITEGTVETQNSWKGLTVTVTRPDNQTETLGPYNTDSTGLTGGVYIPKTAGTYYFQTHFPEQVASWAGAGLPAGTIYKASDSEILPLVVTDEPRTYYPGFSLPTEYWSRPIDSQLREWATIAGNFHSSIASNSRWPDRYAPYVEAPESAHLLWAKQLDEGGLVGDDYYATNLDQIGYEHGDAYQGKFLGSCIINGVLYYNRWYLSLNQNHPQETVAVDLKTGEELWSRRLGWDDGFGTNESLAFGQILYWKTLNLYGAYSYLWTTTTPAGVSSTSGSTWKAYDPSTGLWEFTMINVPYSGNTYTTTVGPNGEFLIYVLDLRNGWMALWNSTAAIPGASFGNGNWSPWGRTWDASVASAYTWNVSIPKDLTGSARMILKDRIIGANTTSYGANGAAITPTFWGISLEPGREGELLFNTPWTRPGPDVTVAIPETFPASVEDGVFVVAAKETRQYYGLSLDTGKQLWGPTKPAEPFLAAYTMTAYRGEWGQAYVYQHMLLTAGMSGQVNAYDVKTGARLWNYNITDEYNESPFGPWWDAPIGLLSDGKVYLFHMEHSGNTPLPRGSPVVCLNATTGDEIFRVNGIRMSSRSGGQPMIADGVIVGSNTYDNRIIAMGKGPSDTTVSASPKISEIGRSVLIEGMITDISPGTRDGILPMRFPDGVPAVSDASMSDWMLYVYQQLPRPTNATGVEVIINVLDPNNNYYEVARTTSDADGFYKVAFEPKVPGEYTIIAEFEGSKSYYGSNAKTAINIEEAPATSVPAESQVASAADLYFIPAVIGIIAAIIIGFALLALLLLRKRP